MEGIPSAMQPTGDSPASFMRRDLLQCTECISSELDIISSILPRPEGIRGGL